MRSWWLGLLLSGLSLSGLSLSGASAAMAAAPRGLLFTEPGHPLSLVPGRDDGMAISSFSIGRVAYSPSGRHWVITASSTATASSPAVQLLFSGTPRGVATTALQNVPLPGLGLAFLSNPDLLAINDSGDFAFGMQVAGGTPSDRVMIARYSSAGQQYASVARQNDVIVGLEQSVPGSAGEKYGSGLSVAGVLADGRVAFVAESTSGVLPTEQDEFLLVEGTPVTVLAQAGALVPGGQAGGGTAVLGNLERRASLAADASHWLVSGQLDAGAFPDVVVVNSRVVLEEGVPVPGLDGVVFAPTVRVVSGGHWWARGTSSSGVGYLIADGALRVVAGAGVPGLPALGLVSRIDSAAQNKAGDLAYAVSTVDGRSHIVVEPAGGAPYVAVDDRTRLNVGGSSRGVLFYGGTIGSELGLGLGDNGWLHFLTRARDLQGLNVADGLFVLRLP